MNWYYVDAGQQAGPVDDAGLDALTASGKITGETLVWRDGMDNWQPLRTAREGALAPPVAGVASAVAAPMAASGVEEAVCAECGGIFPINDTIKVGGARVCANCKPVFVQKMQEGLSVESPGEYRYAGFWIRVLASFVDALVLGAFFFVLIMVLGAAFAVATRNNPGAALLLVLLMYGLFFVMLISYETFFVGKFGATLGKMACGLRVITAEGSQVSYARALGRLFSKFVSRFICGIGYLMIAFDQQKRGLHDRMCNTVVIYK